MFRKTAMIAVIGVCMSGVFALISSADEPLKEYVKFEVVLEPTENAPPDASGTLALEADEENGQGKTEAEIEVLGLLSGTYGIQAILKSGGDPVLLATFEVNPEEEDGANNDGDDAEANQDATQIDEDAAQADDDAGMDEEANGEDATQEGEDTGIDEDANGLDQQATGITLSTDDGTWPSDLDPMDVSAIQIVDSGGLVILHGDLPTAETVQRDVLTAVAGGPAAPNAQGTLTLNYEASGGATTSTFTMAVGNLPAGASFEIVVNGTKAGKAKSDRKGMMRLTSLSRKVDPLAIRRVELRDKRAKLAAAADL